MSVKPIIKTAKKPKEILYAERALWFWAVWMCVISFVHTWMVLPNVNSADGAPYSVPVVVDTQSVLVIAFAVYMVMAAICVWFIKQIGLGKPWARTTLVCNLIFSAILAILFFGGSLFDIIRYIPDILTQTYAVYLTYTRPGKEWFTVCSYKD